MNNKLFSIQDAADALGVSTKTLRRWDQRGRFVPTRTAGNQRRYTQEQISKLKTSSFAKASEGQAKFKHVSEVPPLFSETETPREFKATHSLPSALSGLPSGSFLRNHFLLKHASESRRYPEGHSEQAASIESSEFIEPSKNLEELSEPVSFKRGGPLKLNPFKIGFVFASLVLLLSIGGAFALTKYNLVAGLPRLVAGLTEKKEQFAKFISNLPQISLQIKSRNLNENLSFVPQANIVGSVLAAATGGSDLIFNVNVPAFFSQNVGIGTTAPDTSAILDVVSEEKGFLAPRMTEAQVKAIPTPAAGLFVYNTTTNHYNMYNGTSWQGVFTAIGDSTLGEAFTKDGTEGNSLYFHGTGKGKTQLTGGASSGTSNVLTFPDATGTFITTGNLTAITKAGTISTGVWNGTVLTPSYGGTGVSALTGLVVGNGSGVMTGVTTSAGVATQLSDETGTGLLVFATSPTITTSLVTDSTTFALANTTATTVNFAGAATTLSVGATTGTATINNATTAITGALTANGNVTLGDAITDTITFTGRVAQDSSLIPIGTTGTNDLGSSSLPWDNLYANNAIAGGTSGIFGWLQRNNNAVSPTNITDDILLGATSTSSAKFGFINVAAGTPTATISGNLSLAVPTTAGANTFNLLNNSSLNIQRSPGGDVGLTTVMYLQNSGNVGIGNTAPTTVLDVTGAGTFSSNLAINGGSITTTHTTGNLFNATATTLNVGGAATTLTIGATTGTASIRNATVNFPNATLIGIGNTAPLTALDVTGSASLSANLSYRGSGTTHTVSILDNGNLNYRRSIGGDASVSSTLYLQNDGNIGIGTTAPLTLLDIRGAASASGALTFTTTPTIQSTGMQNIIVGGTTTGGIGLSPASATPSLFVMNGGNVGIGTVTPTTFKLEIAGIIGPTVGSTYDIGSSARRFATIYGDTGNFTNISGTVTGGATTSSDWLINSDNATADTENASLTFERGTPATNTQFLWNSTTKQLSTNSPSFAILPDTTIAYSGTSAFIVNQVQSQDILTASASGTTKFVINNSGNVGIQNATPLTALDVTGSASLSANLSLRGSGTAHTLNILDNGSLNFRKSIGGDAGVSNVLYLENSGNVGIGLTAPTSLLHTSETTARTAAYTGILHSVANTSSTASINKIGMDIESTGTWNGASAVNTGLVVNATGGTTNYAAIFSGGNVGIGTTGPGAKLDVLGAQGTITSALNQKGVLAIQDSTAMAQDVGASITLGGNYDASDNKANFGAIKAGKGSATGGNADGYLSFLTPPATGVLTEKMRITSVGNVGIGNTTPLTALDVTGSASLSANLSLRGSGTAHLFNILDNGTLNIQRSVGGDIAFAATYLFLQNSGNVGIGNTAPGAMLSVGSSTPLLVSSAGLVTVANTTDATSGITGSINTLGGVGITKSLWVGGSANSAQIFAALGTALLPGYSFQSSGTSDPDTGIWSSGANTVNFSTGGTEALRIDSSQRVGIANTTPLTALDVTGSASLSANISLRGSGTAHLFNILQNGTLNFTRSPGGDAVATTSLFIQGDGNVGIGNTAPTFSLQLGSTTNFTGKKFRIISENGLTDIISVTADTGEYGFNIGLTSSGDMNFQRVVNAVASNTMTILRASGNVGIGTASPDRSLTISNASGANYMNVKDGTREILMGVDATAPGVGIISVMTAGHDLVLRAGGNSEKVRIQAGGNVGIGTTAPASLFNVVGGVSLFTNTGDNDQIQMTGSSAGTVAIRFGPSGATTAGARIQGITVGTSAELQFMTFNSERIRIDQNGNVGIGITLPTSFLHTSETTARTAAYTGILHSVANTSSTASINKIGMDIQSTGTWNGTSAVNTGLVVNATGGTTNYAATFSGGNVGIGTTAPGAPLEVKGTGTGATIAKFTDVNTTGCTLATGGTISCSSDFNLKKNISDLGYGLNALMSLRPVEFNWKSEGDGITKSLGFIAQEVELILPKLVTTDLTTGYKELNTIGMVPVLTGAIQEQQGQIASLSGQMVSLTNALSLSGGNLGIGTTAPSFKLDVADMQIAAAAARIFNTDTGTSSAALVLKLGNTSTDTVASTNHFLNFETAGIGIVGSIQGNGGKGVTYATSGIADFAEYFKKDPNQKVEFGSVMCLNESGFAVLCNSLNSKILGIASERPAFLGGENLGNGSIAVGLVGQVETLVSSVNGEIKPGDALTASDIPGVAMKATKPGQIIGKAVGRFSCERLASSALASSSSAQENYTLDASQLDAGKCISKILVSVNVGWYDPAIYIASDGSLSFERLASSKSASSSEAQENYTLDANQLDAGIENDSLFKDLKDKVSSLQSKLDLLSLQFDQQASISGYLAQIQNGGVLGVASNATAASTSATLVKSLGDVEINNAIITDNLMVLGRTTVTDLGVTGTINAGLLAIHGLDGEINTLSGYLYLQKDGFGGVDILAGKVVIDTKGNMIVSGTISANAIEANNYTVLGQQSIGSAVIPAGVTSIEVVTEVASSSSKIFLTTTSLTDKQITVVQKSDGKFKVGIPQPTTSPISFDWWIVGNK